MSQAAGMRVNHLLPGEATHHLGRCVDSAARHLPEGSFLRNRFIFRGSTPQKVLDALAQHGIVLSGDAFRHMPSGSLALFRLFWKISRAGEALVLHGIPNRFVWLLLWPFPGLRRRTYWISWGAGVNGPLRYAERSRSLLVAIWLFVFRRCVPSLGAVSCQNPAERAALEGLVRRRLENYFLARYELMHLPDRFVQRVPSRPLRVLAGQSGRRTNDYALLFELLARFRNEDCEIHVPLAYGDTDYIEEVVALGTRTFGTRFVPRLAKVPLEDYLIYLRTIDVVIFNHSTPGGSGGDNLQYCLACGSRVFLRAENGYFGLLSGHGAHLHTFEDLVGMSWDELRSPLSVSEQRDNFRAIQLQRIESTSEWPQAYRAITARADRPARATNWGA